MFNFFVTGLVGLLIWTKLSSQFGIKYGERLVKALLESADCLNNIKINGQT